MAIFDKLPGPPSKDKFAKLLMDAIHKAGETGEIAYEPEEFRLRGEAEKGSIIFLSNAYQEYCSAPAEAAGKGPQAMRAELVRSSAGDARGIRGREARPAPRRSGPLLFRVEPAPDGG